MAGRPELQLPGHIPSNWSCGVVFWRGVPATQDVKDRPISTANMEIFFTYIQTLPASLTKRSILTTKGT